MTPIAEDSSPRDARWELAYLQLAHGLVMAGAKAKLIERFTSLSHARISALYKALRGTFPAPGPIRQGSVRYFALPSKETSEAWNIQCAIFLACFECMGTITKTPLQRGWRLLASFRAYLSLTEKLSTYISLKQLDINQAYALLTYCGFMTLSTGAELQRKRCSVCSIRYPVIAAEKDLGHGCPVCAINANNKRLSRQASAAGTHAHAARMR